MHLIEYPILESTVIDTGVAAEESPVVLELRRKLRIAQRKILTLNKELQTISKNVKRLFGEDQLHYLKHGTMKGRQWETNTIKKALQLYLTCGTTGYESIKSQHYPLPCIRTLQKRMESFKFESGILVEVLPILKTKVECLKPEERHAVLLVDEMALKPGLEYDTSVEKIIGKNGKPMNFFLGKLIGIVYR